MSKYTLCICTAFAPARLGIVVDVCKTQGDFSSIITSTKDPSKDFKAIKESGKPIILAISHAVGGEALRFLCDDYNMPKDQRRVRWVHSMSVGLDAYGLGTLTKELQDIPFTNAHGCYSSILAEHVMYSVLYFNRKTWRIQENRAARLWEPFDMIRTRGMTMGIIGYGDIGQAVGKLAVAFGMEVTGVKRSPSAKPVDDYGVRVLHGAEERDRVIRESDFLVNILPGTDEMRQFFNKERFATMKSNAVYINIGRGSTQNEQDLVEALKGGVIQGASLDVFAEEPLPKTSPLWDLGNDKVLLTSHSAVVTPDFFHCVANFFVSLFRVFGTPSFDTYVLSENEKRNVTV